MHFVKVRSVSMVEFKGTGGRGGEGRGGEGRGGEKT